MSDKINQLDGKSRKTGYWQHYWTTFSHNPKNEKRIASSGYYLENKKEGLWSCCDPLGNTIYTGTYKLGKMIDLQQWFSANGNLTREQIYII